MQALDPLSTSQTNRCIYGAPIVAIVAFGLGYLMQSCCNHWDCPHCGQVRAKQEYHRIVWGAEVLADEGHKLYFWTLTCRGKECSLEEAEENYYAWTNVLLTNARTKAKRASHFWAYVQVTERQHRTRQHPHSHIITTFCPQDATITHDASGREHLVSEWFTRANLLAQLGSQHKISEVKEAAAVSRYVAKYMFKDSMTEEWPPKWKRVRYSENWPKPPKRAIEQSIALTTPQAWRDLDRMRINFVAESVELADLAKHHMARVSAPMPYLQF